jgi:hypothetical protein
MTAGLAVPIVLSAVAMFVASFVSWMVVQLHRSDWRKLDNEEPFLEALRQRRIPEGRYMFPFPLTPAERNSDEFQKKVEAGPNGLIILFPKVNMGRNLALTMLYYLAVSFCLAYLATLGVASEAGFMPVFRFVSTAAFLVLLAAMVQHAIWYRVRIVGHLVDALVQGGLTGLIFALLW